MKKNLSLGIALALASISLIDAREHCKQRVVGGAVNFSNVSLSGFGCGSTLTANTNIITGKGCFTASPFTITVINDPAGPCPSTDVFTTNETFFTFDVTFCKPFKNRPAVIVGTEIDQSTSFVVPFAVVAGVVCPVIPGGCPAGTPPAFTVNASSIQVFPVNITNKGFAFQGRGTFYTCFDPAAFIPSSDQICQAIQIVGVNVTNAAAADFIAVGE